MKSNRPSDERCGLPSGGDPALARSMGRQLMVVGQLMRREVEQRMAPLGLTDAQWKPLWALRTGQASTANELARGMDIDAGAVTRLVDRLEAKGLIERARSSQDRRVVRLRLTPAGEQAAQVIPEVLKSVNADFLRGFSTEETDRLYDGLQRMAANGLALQSGAQEDGA